MEKPEQAEVAGPQALRRAPVAATFLVLSSASPKALKQSSESLAGRLQAIELPGLGPADTGV